ncbi:nitrite reductase small subunit NirD [Nocardioides sp. 1609]|uniref:nitrite reductase small subunit NirD n=1 Tax=Nocardioides sp. 1609 TaxID=2508327 RepID=UPI00106F598C|nr:nitrite reductase small subunit NirD [Nocardioides sp. 1609]
MRTDRDATTWTTICRLDEIEVEGGVLALVAGEAVAVFRTHDDEVHALSNYDPIGRASVLARGIVGTRGGVPYVASPLHKQGYDLRTGRCLDDEEVRVATYDVAVRDGLVLVASGPPHA